MQQEFLAQRASCEHGVDRSAAREICVRKKKIAVGEKKSENLAEPPSPPLGPHLSGPHPSGPRPTGDPGDPPGDPPGLPPGTPREIFRNAETPREHPRDTPGEGGREGQSEKGSGMVVSRDRFNTWIWNEDGFRSPSLKTPDTLLDLTCRCRFFFIIVVL